VRNYRASIRLFDVDHGHACIMQWVSTFDYTEDALTEFYWNGFRALQERFPTDDEPNKG